MGRMLRTLFKSSEDKALLVALNERVAPVQRALLEHLQARQTYLRAGADGETDSARDYMQTMFKALERAKELHASNLVQDYPYDSPLLARIDAALDRCIAKYGEAAAGARQAVKDQSVETLQRSEDVVEEGNQAAREVNEHLRTLGVPIRSRR